MDKNKCKELPLLPQPPSIFSTALCPSPLPSIPPPPSIPGTVFYPPSLPSIPSPHPQSNVSSGIYMASPIPPTCITSTSNPSTISPTPIPPTCTTSTSSPLTTSPTPIPPALGKAEEKARKKELKAQYKAVKKETKVREKEASRQACELKKELKHQAAELKKELKHQTTELKRTLKAELSLLDNGVRDIQPNEPASSSNRIRTPPSAALPQHPMVCPPASNSSTPTTTSTTIGLPETRPIHQSLVEQIALREQAKHERRLAHKVYKNQKREVRQEHRDQRRLEREHGHAHDQRSQDPAPHVVHTIHGSPRNNACHPPPGINAIHIASAPPFQQPVHSPSHVPVLQPEPTQPWQTMLPTQTFQKSGVEKDIGAQDPLIVFAVSRLSLSLEPPRTSAAISAPSAPTLDALVSSSPEQHENGVFSEAPPPPYEFHVIAP